MRFFIFNALLCTLAFAGGVQYLGNNQRTGYSPKALPTKLHLQWTHLPRHAPRPAWKEPVWEPQRIDQDYSFAVTAADGMLYFGSSADHGVHALDAATGEERWVYYTEGPVRFAPAIADGRVFASSDDGYLHCLDAQTGGQIWKYRPEIPDERLVGNEQVMSRWPSRTGPVVRGDQVFATFGMWSPEGIFVCCIDTTTGTEVWVNDSSGAQSMAFPHFRGIGGTSPNGYLALCGDTLVVPNGRATPAFFDAKTGRFVYHQSEGLFPGGAWTMTYKDLAFTPSDTLKKPNLARPTKDMSDFYKDACLVAIEASTGKEVFHLQGGCRAVVADNGELTVIGRRTMYQTSVDQIREAAGKMKPKRIGNSIGHFVPGAGNAQWQVRVPHLYRAVRAGDTIYAGGEGVVLGFDAKSGKVVWESKIKGAARELLVADGRLFVSSTTGEIHCFAGKPAAARTVRTETAKSAPKTVVQHAGVTQGYALVVGEASVDFLSALVAESKLQVTCVMEEGADDLRKQLAKSGLQGTRIVVHEASVNPLPYAEYMFDLVILNCENAPELSAGELRRVMRPCGGVAMVRFPKKLSADMERWLEPIRPTDVSAHLVPSGLKLVRGKLGGAGVWTHQLADAGNTGASDDRLVKLPLRMLWFGGMGPGKVVSRHYRTPSPLAVNGRVFMPGIDDVIAMNAYNGRILWERRLPDVGHWPAAYRGTCAVADDDAIYVLQGMKCLRLDAATGKTTRTYEAPRKGGSGSGWEYLAMVGNTLIGGVGVPNVKRMWWSKAYPENRVIFAVDKKSGAVLWTHNAANGVDTNTIACAGSRIYFIDGIPKYEKRRVPEQDRKLVALDLSTGEMVWSKPVGSTEDAVIVKGGRVFVGTTMGTRNLGRHPEHTGGEASAYAANDGRLLWKQPKAAWLFPVVIDDTLWLPLAVDVKTGKMRVKTDPFSDREFNDRVTMGTQCSRIAGSPNLITARSGAIGFYDMARGTGQHWYPNVRASCWINAIPAQGLVLAPEGSSSCPCAYDYKTSIALVPAKRQGDWGIIPKAGRLTGGLKEIRLNCGAPGDRADSRGKLWLAWPRPADEGPIGAGGMSRINAYDPGIRMTGSPSKIIRHPDFLKVEQSWLNSSALVGPLKLELPMTKGNYNVTLMFADPQSRPVQAEILIQGKAMDTVKPVPGQAIRKAFPVVANGTLTIELRGASASLSGLSVCPVGDQ